MEQLGKKRVKGAYNGPGGTEYRRQDVTADVCRIIPPPMERKIYLRVKSSLPTPEDTEHFTFYEQKKRCHLRAKKGSRKSNINITSAHACYK